ncbi:hypothetical protein SKAU_G00228750 [Synaphobranchus kaupii]|uniref:Uncharacterized protein n=1 Tax=Synaphobranchus kaupii TaxID=118154 RepID=A0A9Q1IT21_SYNKA|nr:hypothetical protein SKAU_G00228750 [Synaphobranchus kaupii]
MCRRLRVSPGLSSESAPLRRFLLHLQKAPAVSGVVTPRPANLWARHQAPPKQLPNTSKQNRPASKPDNLVKESSSWLRLSLRSALAVYGQQGAIEPPLNLLGDILKTLMQPPSLPACHFSLPTPCQRALIGQGAPLSERHLSRVEARLQIVGPEGHLPINADLSCTEIRHEMTALTRLWSKVTPEPADLGSARDALMYPASLRGAPPPPCPLPSPPCMSNVHVLNQARSTRSPTRLKVTFRPRCQLSASVTHLITGGSTITCISASLCPPAPTLILAGEDPHLPAGTKDWNF